MVNLLFVDLEFCGGLVLVCVRLFFIPLLLSSSGCEKCDLCLQDDIQNTVRIGFFFSF